MTIINLVYGKHGRIPSIYQEVEYIQSSGTQWINTGLYANQNTVVETKWNLVQYNSAVSYDKFYGTYGSNGSRCFFLQSNRPENYKIRTVNYSNNLNTYKIDSSSAITTGIDYTVKHSATEFWLNGVLQGSCGTRSYTSPSTITIFALHDGSSVTQNVYLKLYYFKMYSGTTLQRDFVPCYRKSDNVIGLYDIVNNQFYTNSGSGTFIKGADVTHWTPNANTLAYYPLTSSSTVNDYSGNGITLTNNGNVLFGTYHGVDCANYSGNGSLRNSVLTTGYIGQTFTISEWVLRHGNEFYIGTANNVGTKRAIGINVASTFINFTFGTGSAWKDNKYSINTVTDQWYHIALTHNSTGNLIGYVNGQQVITGNVTIGEGASNFGIGASVFSENEIYYSNGNVSNVILENKVRTAQEILGYYNQTKSKYGL